MELIECDLSTHARNDGKYKCSSRIFFYLDPVVRSLIKFNHGLGVNQPLKS